jgi:branched-subunit amino acid transport protein
MKRRRNTRAKDMISKLSNKLAKIPVLGGFLSFAPYGAAAALMVEPVLMLQQALGRFVPNMSAPLFYGISGLVAGGLIKLAHQMFLKKLMSAYTADKLAVAAASAGGAIAYYKFRTQGNTSDTVAEEMGALELRGFSGPLGMLELRGFGGSHSHSHMSGYGDYGPAAVMPLGTY